jgi:hypothetical protein
MPLISQIKVDPKQGLLKTIEVMNLLEQRSFAHQDFIKFVFEKFSSNCAACIPGKIWNYMQENFQYIPDDPFDELLIAPYLMPQIKKGDCDDFSLFAKTCIDLLGGFYSNYILFSKEKSNYSHVAVFVHRGIYNNTFIDGVVIDGANENFNIIPPAYNFYKLI